MGTVRYNLGKSRPRMQCSYEMQLCLFWNVFQVSPKMCMSIDIIHKSFLKSDASAKIIQPFPNMMMTRFPSLNHTILRIFSKLLRGHVFTNTSLHHHLLFAIIMTQ